MKLSFHPLAVFAAIPLLAQCVSSEIAPPSLVVEGYIADGEYPKICLMQTISPEREGNSLADMVVRWGTVSISDGRDSLLLIGGPDKSYFPPYTYNTYDMKGTTGQTYTLRAEYEGMRVKATTTIPPAVPIDSITIHHEAGDDSCYRLTLHLTARADSNEYFRVMARVKWLHDRLLPSFMGVSESAGKGGPLAIAVNRPRVATDTIQYTPAFMSGEIVEVALCSIDKEAYQFWLDYENTVAFSGSQFLAPSTPLRSNVEGGYGYFFGYGMSKKTVTIPFP